MKRLSCVAVLMAVLMVSLWMPAEAESDKYDLDNFGWRYVQSEGRGSLIFQNRPYGEFMKQHKFYSGDQIYVNLYWRENGYAIAYEDGEYGYVDASYIDWSSGGYASGASSSPIYSGYRDLSNFGYRRVATKGRGALVFQEVPRGEMVYGHSFDDGDYIYVNLDYREDGYAIAYENGEYGYVDASYIDWGSTAPSGGNAIAYGGTALNIAPEAFPLVFQTSGFGWGSSVVVRADMTFTGDYHYRDVDVWDFSGTLSDIRKINDYTYEMVVRNFSAEGKGQMDDVIGAGHRLRMYLPGADADTVENLYDTDQIGFGRSENYLYSKNGRMTVYVLCNLTSHSGFVAQ